MGYSKTFFIPEAKGLSNLLLSTQSVPTCYITQFMALYFKRAWKRVWLPCLRISRHSLLVPKVNSTQTRFDWATARVPTTGTLLFCLFVGVAYHSLKTSTSSKPPAIGKSSQVEEETWACLQNRLLVPLAAQLMQHVARVLCICAHVIEGTQPGPPKSQVWDHCRWFGLSAPCMSRWGRLFFDHRWLIGQCGVWCV